VYTQVAIINVKLYVVQIAFWGELIVTHTTDPTPYVVRPAQDRRQHIYVFEPTQIASYRRYCTPIGDLG
jgi:hypothetical protein